ncbi:MAG: DNA helicase PcrA [Nitrospirota bacterium]
MDFLSELNPRQLEAVECTEGPLQILAGAGSGKTRVITYRIAHLIKNKGVPPWNIIAVTFTNKAASEMKERIDGLIKNNMKDILIRTFHSACLMILRREIGKTGYRPDFVIYDTGDQSALIKECIRELNINEELYKPKVISERISSLKNQLITPLEYTKYAIQFGLEKKVKDIYELYQKKLYALNALDFDDLLMVTVDLFNRFPEVLENYQSKFRYIMVDEYQDTNHAQYRLIKLLADRYKNICVVGDEDQSIYRFRGADIENILSFEKDFPDAKIIKLEQNYRSTQTILDAAGIVVKQNSNRKGKNLWTENKEGEKIVCFEAMDEMDEASYLCRIINRLRREEDKEYGDFCILYRINAQSRAIEDALRMEGIPYIIIGGLRFYERKEIKDIIAYIRIISNPGDAIALKRIINIPTRGIGKLTVEKIERLSVERGISFYNALQEISRDNPVSGISKRGIEGFLVLIDELLKLKGRYPVSGLLTEIMERVKYKDYLRKEYGREAEDRLRNLNELRFALKDFENNNEPDDIKGFLDQVVLVSPTDELSDASSAITLMTLHSAKGLEFPVIFITGMEEGLFPHSRSLSDRSEIEEERRLCYVGMTRAKEKLYLTWSHRRRIYGGFQQNMSRFLAEIPEEFTLKERGEGTYSGYQKKRFVPFWDQEKVKNWAADCDTMPLFPVGSRVRHPIWGIGTVKMCHGREEDGRVIINFPTVGTKRLAIKYAKLERI